MSLVERLKSQTKVLRAAELASLLEVTPQHIYKLASSGRMPSIRVARAIRFDPHQVPVIASYDSFTYRALFELTSIIQKTSWMLLATWRNSSSLA